MTNGLTDRAYATGGNTLALIPAGIVIVSINTGAYITEIVRGGIISIDKGQFEGASSIGMSHFQTMIYVVIEELIPESNNGAFKKYGTWSAIVGFVIMMILDLAF